MEDDLKQKTITGFFWQFSQKFLGQALHFIVTVILARLLMPEDYGIVALVGMFNVLVGIFINGSMDVALVQKKNADELDYNTVFYSSLCMSFVIYSIVFFSAPYFAQLYRNDIITPIMRVSALAMPIGAFSMVQNATVSRQMEFKRFFYATLSGQILAATVAIIMAYNKYGPWALVAQSIISTTTNTIVLFHLNNWRPKWMFSWERFKGLFSYAWKRTAAGFMGTFCNQLKGYLIGYKYTAADLAYFNRGEGLPEMLKNNISGTIDSVLLPAFSKIQDDVDFVKRGVRRSIKTSSFIVFPVLVGLAATAGNVVPILYSAKWSPAVPFMQIACATLCVILLNNTNLQTLYALGRTDIVLKQEFIKKPVMLFILAITVPISPLAISFGIFFHHIHELFWTCRASSKLIHYSLKEQLNDVRPGLIAAIVMGLLVSLSDHITENPYLSLLVQIPFGVIVYWTISHVFKLESYLYVKDFVKVKIHRK